MGKLRIRKLEGAVILETMIALTISLILFLLVTVIFVQITGKSASFAKINAHEILNDYSVETLDQKSYFDETRAVDGFILKRQITTIDSLPGIIRLRFLIFEQNNQLIDQMDKLTNGEK